MGKLKKVGIGFGIVILSFFVLVAIGASMTPDSEYPDEIDYDKMSNSQLSAMAVDWDYRDIQRNFDNYENHIIFVDGTVSKIQRDLNSLTLCINMGSFSCDEHMFVDVDDNKWLEDDILSGFVKVEKLSETGSSNMFTGGEWVGSGNYVPQVKEIRLICDNC